MAVLVVNNPLIKYAGCKINFMCFHRQQQEKLFLLWLNYSVRIKEKGPPCVRVAHSLGLEGCAGKHGFSLVLGLLNVFAVTGESD